MLQHGPRFINHGNNTNWTPVSDRKADALIQYMRKL